MSHLVQSFIGIMSGTSTDAVDAVLVQITTCPTGQTFSLQARANQAIPHDLRQTLLALNRPAFNELETAAKASLALGELYAQVSLDLLHQSGLSAQAIEAIGIHGQTVRHQPSQGYSLQLNAPALVAERTGIDVIADFRSRDLAAGGQGAPLIPAFHHAFFKAPYERSLLNIGGIANLSLLRPDQPTLGFDCGPGNMLMDAWCFEQTGKKYDHDGLWGAQGQVQDEFLHFLLEEPWLSLPAPKSTGRDLFNRTWLDDKINRFKLKKNNDWHPTPQAIQATLRAFTRSCIVDALARYAPHTQEIIVFGGGAMNKTLMQELQQAVSCPIRLSDALGIPTQDMEATAFAWFAWAFKNNYPICTPSMTGARHSTIAGCLYPR